LDSLVLRSAVQTDSSQIRELIHLVGINPMGLDWKRFVVVVNEKDEVVACGQIKLHRSEVYELASIAVKPGYRGQGLARRVIESLLAKSPRPLYLMCLASMGKLYEKFGFSSLEYERMPRYFQKIAKLAGLTDTLMKSGDGLLVMKME
jgi:N-acetylglutamate synthase-like GNAT family acetyltransferase